MLGLSDEAALYHELRQLQVDVGPPRRIAEDLVAQSDGVVGESGLSVPIHRPLIGFHRSLNIVGLQVEVTDFVEQGQVTVQLLGPLELVDDLGVGLECLLPLALDLVLAGSFLCLFDVQGGPLPALSGRK